MLTVWPADCLPGFGLKSSDGGCTPCIRGTYNPGLTALEYAQCQPCPTHNYVYTYAEQVRAIDFGDKYSGPVNSGATTMKPGAENEAECLPVAHQLVSDTWSGTPGPFTCIS